MPAEGYFDITAEIIIAEKYRTIKYHKDLGICWYELKFNPNLFRNKIPNKVKSTRWITDLNEVLNSPIRVNSEMIIIPIMNLSPRVKLIIIIITTGITNSKFSLKITAGILNAIDKTNKRKSFVRIISVDLNNFIILKDNVKVYIFLFEYSQKIYADLSLLLMFRFLNTLPEIIIELCLIKIEFIK